MREGGSGWCPSFCLLLSLGGRSQGLLEGLLLPWRCLPFTSPVAVCCCCAAAAAACAAGTVCAAAACAAAAAAEAAAACAAGTACAAAACAAAAAAAALLLPRGLLLLLRLCSALRMAGASWHRQGSWRFEARGASSEKRPRAVVQRDVVALECVESSSSATRRTLGWHWESSLLLRSSWCWQRERESFRGRRAERASCCRSA
jgi:hypothetical protein